MVRSLMQPPRPVKEERRRERVEEGEEREKEERKRGEENVRRVHLSDNFVKCLSPFYILI